MEDFLPKNASFYLSSEGPFAKNNFFEEREGQIALCEKIDEAFKKNKIGVFEAGTGVGKSFAYLIPAILRVSESDERIVISTGTINLQQQLIEKDIPQAKKIVQRDVKAVLVKGRQNFLCLRRLLDAKKDEDSLFLDDENLIKKIVAWAEKTKDGSKSDLPFFVSEKLWSRINSESDICFGARCSFFRECFVTKMKKSAMEAKIIVANHHVLFADAKSRMNGGGYSEMLVLPPYDAVIFDEAHGIQSAAESFFGESFSKFKFQKQLNFIYRQRGQGFSGSLFVLSALCKEDLGIFQIEKDIFTLKSALSLLDETALEVLENDFSLRLFLFTKKRFEKIFFAIDNFLSVANKVIFSIEKILETLSSEKKEDLVIFETSAILKRMRDLCAVLENFKTWDENSPNVFWLQKSRLSFSAKNSESKTKNAKAGFFVIFNQTPLDTSVFMKRGIFDPLKTTICTSATLGINGKMDFWEKKTGIFLCESSRVLRGTFKSPFLYEKNVIFAVPRDAPMVDDENFLAFCEKAIVRLINAAGGRTLVLFTSHDVLNHIFEAAKFALSDSGITIFKQGDDDRFRLLSAFKEDFSSVLFATDSFWEGVDVPGESLSQLIIVKLPFGVPTDPVFAAKSEKIKNQDENPFLDLSLPDAVIKFRQGFGRLVRKKDDRGVVIVLDRRLFEKHYGKIFLRAIPPCKKIYEPLNSILNQIPSFLQN